MQSNLQPFYLPLAARNEQHLNNDFNHKMNIYCLQFKFSISANLFSVKTLSGLKTIEFSKSFSHYGEIMFFKLLKVQNVLSVVRVSNQVTEKIVL